MRFQKLDLFPTSVLKFDCSEVFTNDELSSMIKDVDIICENPELIQKNDLAPKFQCIPMLFGEKAPAAWQKLKESFIDCCKQYLNIVENFNHNQDKLEFTHARAWFYKTWGDVNKNQVSPWHNHNPSFLSGVFYLKIPQGDDSCGTEFHDPRFPEHQVPRFQAVVPTELCWVIFPGWLVHRAHTSTLEEPRYTIAADSYVKVL